MGGAVTLVGQVNSATTSDRSRRSREIVDQVSFVLALLMSVTLPTAGSTYL